MKNLFYTLFLLFFQSILFSQNTYISADLNYSWMNKIEASVKSRQVFSPGFTFQYGRLFFFNGKIALYTTGSINWLSAGVVWEEKDFDIHVKSNFNNLRFEAEGGVSISIHKKLTYELGFNNSFGVKLKGEFSLSEQGTTRNWAPMIVSKLIFRRNQTSRWVFGLKLATGLRQIHYIQSINTETKIRYESSNDYAAIVFRCYLR